MENELLSITCEENTVEMPQIVVHRNLVELESLGDKEYEAILKYTSALQKQNEKIELYHQKLDSKANVEDVPTKNSQLENDSNFAKIEQLPTKMSELEADCDFATNEEVGTKISTEILKKANCNLDNVSATGKESISTIRTPDYSREIAIGVNQVFTPTCDGVIEYYVSFISSYGFLISRGSVVSLSTIVSGAAQAGLQIFYTGNSVSVTKGQSYNIDLSGASSIVHRLAFIPYKGV